MIFFRQASHSIIAKQGGKKAKQDLETSKKSKKLYKSIQIFGESLIQMILITSIFFIIKELFFPEIGITFALCSAKIMPEKERRLIRVRSLVNRDREI
jgi:ascorbate-specific PTS system EIIC-type component UlaA